MGGKNQFDSVKLLHCYNFIVVLLIYGSKTIIDYYKIRKDLKIKWIQRSS